MNKQYIERKWVQRGTVIIVTSPLAGYALPVAGVPSDISFLTAYFWGICGLYCVLMSGEP